MKWITRERPKIDRLACPWLIKRFIDKEAEFIYVPFEEVKQEAAVQNAIPFDVPGVELTHYGDECTFDYLIKKYDITDSGVLIMAPIVRGADTDRHDLAAQASGLWAISAGLAYNIGNDYDLLNKGMILYDALYSWATHLQGIKHIEQPFENLLVSALQQFIDKKSGGKKKIPAWARQLKNMIQDHIDTNITLKEISQNLDLSHSYLSREFSKYFEDLSFGEYIRKQRIDKAIELMNNAKYSLTEIAYLTGFSDQSHFNRIFRQQTGSTPSVYRKRNTEK